MSWAILVAVLAVFWTVGTESFAWANWAMGAVVGAVCIAVGREDTRLFEGRPRLRALAWLALSTVGHIVASSARVTRRTLFSRRALRPAIMEVPLEIQGDFPIMLLANLISLTPGTTTIAWDEDRRSLYVHVLDTEDPADEARMLKRNFEKPIGKAFGA